MKIQRICETCKKEILTKQKIKVVPGATILTDDGEVYLSQKFWNEMQFFHEECFVIPSEAPKWDQDDLLEVLKAAGEKKIDKGKLTLFVKTNKNKGLDEVVALWYAENQ